MSSIETNFTHLSLTLGFSPVWKTQNVISRFNGFARQSEAVETADVLPCGKITGLKPGANENLSRALKENL